MKKLTVLTTILVSLRIFAADPQVLTQMKQLTFEGPRAGEGYFSADGKKMIFQSERESGNPFYQIYLMDLETGKTERVSTGKGKTTCAWIHPSGQKVMFSSTHLDPKLADKVKAEYSERQSPQKNKYSWSYDDQFSIFEYDLKTKKTKRLIKERGYNAEGSYSPDGKYIAFASNYLGYTEKLKPEDKKMFDQDPSYMADLYIMKADGSDMKRLTSTRGYNGGPFFSPDGERLVFRRFTPDGHKAEVFSIGIDGKNEKQLTKIGAMSWAPFYHPSGDYIIFTTNVLGYHNFELYIVDVEGKKEPVRVSYLDGFDGLPVFTPDGQKMAWTRKNEKGESQIYIANWDDAKARSLLGLSPPGPRLSVNEEPFAITEMKSLMNYFAGADLGGRATGSSAEVQYTKTVAKMFSDLGLKPIDGKSFVQPYEFISGVAFSAGPGQSLSLTVGGETFKAELEKEFMPISFSKSGKFSKAPVVFAGYGIVAPAHEKVEAYNSYAGLDVKGKWVLAFRDIPENVSVERKMQLNVYARNQHKATVARQNGALGLLLINGPRFEQKVMTLKFEGGLSDTDLPVLSVSTEFASRLLKKPNIEQMLTQLDKGEMIAMPLEGISVEASVDLQPIKSKGLNVVGVLQAPGLGMGAKTVAIGAHGDHLGHGELGNSLAKKSEAQAVHFGADDNASGLVGVLQLAKYFAQTKVQKNLKQNMMFAIWSGEEMGNLGSTNFLRQNKTPITAYLNMDMIGRLRTSLAMQGLGSAKQWKSIFEQLAPTLEAPVTTQDDPYLPTDAMAFYLKKIPTISFFTGSHAEYHTPRDTVDLINFEGLQKSLLVVKSTAQKLAESAQSLVTYQKVESKQSNLPGRSFRIYLGTIPDYTQEGAKGVKISGTTKDSPAEKAGLKEGDVIVELSGAKIQNLYDYVYALQALKPDQETPIKILRQGKLEEYKITPKLKE